MARRRKGGPKPTARARSNTKPRVRASAMPGVNPSINYNTPGEVAKALPKIQSRHRNKPAPPNMGLLRNNLRKRGIDPYNMGNKQANAVAKFRRYRAPAAIAAAGVVYGGGALARNTGRGTSRTRGRPTGIYKF